MADLDPRRIAELIEPYRVRPNTKVRLPDDFDPGDTAGWKKREVEPARILADGIELLAEYQARLAAQDTYGLLVVLQAMDAAGKDGTIKHVMSGVNPQGVSVYSFKVPSPQELDHDYLWRYARALPARGEIGIFNRSYYEEVLVVRVHPTLLEAEKLPPESKGKGIWQRRLREIDDWERYLFDNGIRVVKLFLNISREEQRRRFLARIDTPSKNWKFSAADARERAYWDDYQAAFSDVLSHTSTERAPWFVIPADHKWFARIVAAAVIADALIGIDPHYPVVTEAARADLLAAKAELEAEAPRGQPADPDETGQATDAAADAEAGGGSEPAVDADATAAAEGSGGATASDRTEGTGRTRKRRKRGR